jgi:hypothetical protein
MFPKAAPAAKRWVAHQVLQIVVLPSKQMDNAHNAPTHQCHHIRNTTGTSQLVVEIFWRYTSHSTM